MWTESYRPEGISDLVGNSKTREKVIQWLQDWEPGEDHAIAHGPPGVGKTSLAFAMANDFGMIPYEINASDKRTGGSIGEEILEVSQSGGFLGEDRLLIVDEVDNLDRGGARALRDAMDEATQPMFLVCNELWDGVANSVRNRCEEFEFDPISEGPMVQRLRQICESEDLNYTIEALRKIAKNTDGDVRAAVNDLHTVSTDEITRERVTDFYSGTRRKTSLLLFGGPDPSDTEEVLDDFENKIRSYDEIWIRGTPGWDIVAGEWARKRNIPLVILPPFYEDRLIDNDIWQVRYDELARYGQHMDSTFYQEDPDWEEYSREFQWVDGAMGWIEDDDFGTQELAELLPVNTMDLSLIY